MELNFNFRSDGLEVKIPDNLSVLPVRDIVPFPGLVLPLFAARPMSIKAVEYALSTDKLVFLLAQKEISIQNLTPGDLYSIGIVAIIMRMLRLPDGRVEILVQGLTKARALFFSQTEPFFKADIEKKEIKQYEVDMHKAGPLMLEVKEKLDEAIFNYGKAFPVDILAVIENLTDDPEKLAHLVAANLRLELPLAQNILEINDPTQKLIKVSAILDEQIGIFKELNLKKTQ